jgi:hypothetical protein
MSATGTTAATPQSIDPGSVIASAVSIYKSQFAILIGAAVIVFAVEAVLVLLLGWIGAILTIVVSTFFQGMVVELVRDVQDGRRDSSFGDLFTSIAPVVLPLFAVSLLAGIGIAIGFVLLIVPGLFLLTIWSVIVPVIVLEHAGAFDSFGRSRELVRGYGWTVLGVIIVTFVINVVVSIVLGILFAGFSAEVTRYLSDVISNTLISPFIAATWTSMYFTLRRLHEPAEVPAGAAYNESG